MAERAIQRAADLRGDAERATVGFGNVDALDFMRLRTSSPLGRRNSHLRVPSLETCSATTSGRATVKCCSSCARISLEMLVISSNALAPRTYIQCQSCCVRILRCAGADADLAQPVGDLGARQADQRRFCRRHVGFERDLLEGSLSAGTGLDFLRWCRHGPSNRPSRAHWKASNASVSGLKSLNACNPAPAGRAPATAPSAKRRRWSRCPWPRCP